MPGLVLPNGSEIEIYDAGSAVSPINDRKRKRERMCACTFEGNSGALSSRSVEGERERERDAPSIT